jgi:hypothetical protein
MGSTAERERAFLHARILSFTSGECVMAFKQTRGNKTVEACVMRGARWNVLGLSAAMLGARWRLRAQPWNWRELPRSVS